MGNDYNKPTNDTLTVENWAQVRDNIDDSCRLFTGVSPITNAKDGFKRFNSSGFFEVYSTGTGTWGKLDFSKIDYDTQLDLTSAAGKTISVLDGTNGPRISNPSELSLKSGLVDNGVNLTLIPNFTGVNQPAPAYTLDVGGSVNFTGGLYNNGTLVGDGVTPWTNKNDDIYYSAGNTVGIQTTLSAPSNTDMKADYKHLRIGDSTGIITDDISNIEIINNAHLDLAGDYRSKYATGSVRLTIGEGFDISTGTATNPGDIITLTTKFSVDKNGNVTVLGSVDGRDLAVDGTKLDTIDTGANNYVHPTTNGNKHIPVDGTAGDILKWGSLGTATWGPESPGVTDHPSLTGRDTADSHPQSAITNLVSDLAGKVDNNQVLTDVPSGAVFTDTIYTLPVADTSIGGVKEGGAITIDAAGVMTVLDDSHNHIISNVDGLQTALDGKVDDSQVMTDVPSGAVFTDTNYWTEAAGNIYFQSNIAVGSGNIPDGSYNIKCDDIKVGIIYAANGDSTTPAIHAAVSNSGMYFKTNGHNPTLVVDGVEILEVDSTGIKEKGQYLSSKYQVAGTYNTTIGTSTDIDTTGAQVIDQLLMTDGVITTHSTRTLTLADLGFTGDSNANYYAHPDTVISEGNHYLTGSGTCISGYEIANGHLKTVYTTTRDLSYFGFTGDSNANYYAHPTTNLSDGTHTISGNNIISSFVVSNGHLDSVNTVLLTLSSLGFTGDTNANYYVHPTTSGNKHIPAGGTTSDILEWSADGTAAWVAPSVSATSGSIVRRDGNGDSFSRYSHVEYINLSHGVGERTTDTVFYSGTGDGYIRKNSKNGLLASLGLENVVSDIGDINAALDAINGEVI